MAFGTFDLGKLLVTYDGQIITGFAEGDDVVEVDKTSDSFTSKAGAGGEVARAKSNDRRGTVTIKLFQTARSNDLLTAYHALDEAGVSVPKALVIIDLNTNSKHVAPEAWVKKTPKASYGAGVNEREWVFECSEIITTILGNAI